MVVATIVGTTMMITTEFSQQISKAVTIVMVVVVGARLRKNKQTPSF